MAILTTNVAEGELLDFDATTVDPLSVKFGPNGATEAHKRGHIDDADGDGDLDLVLHFKTQETGILLCAIQATPKFSFCHIRRQKSGSRMGLVIDSPFPAVELLSTTLLPLAFLCSLDIIPSSTFQGFGG